MNWIERCPECGGVHYRETIYHVFSYLTSSRYRQALRKAEEEAVFWRKLTDRPRIKEGEALTWQEIDLTQITARRV